MADQHHHSATDAPFDVEALALSLAREWGLVGIDPRKLKPGELIRLLNSTPLGTVITERILHRHRGAAGFRIGDGKTVDLFRYAAWLATERHRATPTEPSGYDAHRERARKRQQALSTAGRDIGEAAGDRQSPAAAAV